MCIRDRFKTINVLLKGTEIRKANSEIQLKQRNGSIWTHTLEEFQKMFSKNYRILDKEVCFLNCSHLLVAMSKY